MLKKCQGLASDLDTRQLVYAYGNRQSHVLTPKATHEYGLSWERRAHHVEVYGMPAAIAVALKTYNHWLNQNGPIQD